MKRFIGSSLALLILISAIPSCRYEPDATDTPETPVESQTASENQTQNPDDDPPEEIPMENIATYTNPIMTNQTENAWPSYGFGDPFVMRYNGVYYLYVSTKDGCVGIKCWSSPDLVNWTYEGFCSNDPVTRGAYAPEVYYYNGYFYMYTSPAGNGHYVLRSTSPTKGFEVVTNNMGMSIDGSVFIDHNGKWYFYTAGNGAMQVYDMTSPTSMRNGRPLSAVSVNGAWTEGAMTVYHDGYYYITYTGNHVLSPSYRILYGASDKSPVGFKRNTDGNPLLISTSGDVHGIGHSSTVKGPDLDSYYLVYHALLDTTPNRTMNIDRIIFNGERMEIQGPTTAPQQVPDMPDVYHRFEPGSSLKGWSLTGSLRSGGTGLHLAADSTFVSKTAFAGDFTAEYNVTSISDGGLAGAIFAYSDENNFGACYFSPTEQKVVIEITVNGITTRTEKNTIRSFGEDTRFDCLQALQIERSGKNYTFYMNDRLLCTIEDSALAGGSIGYVTKGGSATFGFIGGTGAVGGRGCADQYVTVADRATYIPAFASAETYPTVIRDGGIRTAAVTAGDTLTYHVLATKDSGYDLSLLCHGVKSKNVTMQIAVDGQAAGQVTISGSESNTATAVLRGFSMTAGQHTISVTVTEGDIQLESLEICLNRTVQNVGDLLTATVPSYSDGEWKSQNGYTTMTGTGSYGKRMFGSKNWGDYVAEVTVTPNASPNCGLLVRATNPGVPTFLGVTPTREDARTATDWVEGYFVGLTSDGVILGKQSYSYEQLAKADGKFSSGETYRLKVICEGSRFRVFVDDVLYIDYTDPQPFMQGMVGLRTHNCAVTFSNLTVKPYNGQ